MRILLVNPNSTSSMTDKAALAARAVVGEAVEIVAVNPTESPKSIQGYYDGAMCLAPMIKEVSKYPDVDAIIIACFDDTGLDAIRCMTTVPVIGIGEAAYHYASIIANKFSVVTTLQRSVPVLESNLLRYGLSKKCVRVRASEVEVLALEQASADAVRRISDEISKAKEEDQAEAIVLGCAGMTDLAKSLEQQHALPVLDGVTCAASLAQSMVALSLCTSKAGAYATPENF